MTDTQEITKGDVATITKEAGVSLSTEGLPASLADAIAAELSGSGDPLARVIETWDEIMRAAKPEDVLGRADARSSKDHTGVPFVVAGVKLYPSTFEGTGPAVFASIRAVDPATGEGYYVNTSNPDAIAFLLGCKVKGWLPMTSALQFVRSERPTAAGFYPVVLTPASIEEVAAYVESRQATD